MRVYQACLKANLTWGFTLGIKDSHFHFLIDILYKEKHPQGLVHYLDKSQILDLLIRNTNHAMFLLDKRHTSNTQVLIFSFHQFPKQ